MKQSTYPSNHLTSNIPFLISSVIGTEFVGILFLLQIILQIFCCVVQQRI